MPNQFIRTETRGRILTITINRPEVRNALNSQANRELADAFDAYEADDGLAVAIITGAGDKAFCAGADLKASVGGEPLILPASGFGGLTSRWTCKKPIIAAVNGLAVGGGFEIVLACDIVVAVPAAAFALPEVRLGLAPVAGGMHRLARKIGLSQAMPLLLTGRRITANEACAVGLVTEVGDDAIAVAMRWARELLECSPTAVRAIKSVVMEGLDRPVLREANDREGSNTDLLALFASADFTEGPRSFAEKRAPDWRVDIEGFEA